MPGEIPPWLGPRIDELLHRLGYPALADVFDEDSVQISSYCEETEVGTLLIEQLRHGLAACLSESWSFGIGKFIVIDGRTGVYLDAAHREARFVNVEIDEQRHFDFVVLTDTFCVRRIISGQMSLSEAVRDGRFSVRPSESIAPGDYQQLFRELTGIVTYSEKIKIFEPSLSMMATDRSTREGEETIKNT